jgi:hypothetical protein
LIKILHFLPTTCSNDHSFKFSVSFSYYLFCNCVHVEFLHFPSSTSRAIARTRVLSFSCRAPAPNALLHSSSRCTRAAATGVHVAAYYSYSIDGRAVVLLLFLPVTVMSSSCTSCDVRRRSSTSVNGCGYAAQSKD